MGCWEIGPWILGGATHMICAEFDYSEIGEHAAESLQHGVCASADPTGQGTFHDLEGLNTCRTKNFVHFRISLHQM